ncbi:MAG: hypothetical protein IID32_10105, partial [Planctomycetes bacterium]|nr:hypothetical protein [Planctomycetota bacterium]
SACFNFKTLPATPIIQSDPENVLVIDGGGPVTYTVTATDVGLFGDINYQWFGSISGALANHTHISGVNDGLGTGTSTLTIDPAGFPDEQDYFCIASNSEGAGDLSTSDSAFLRIKQLLAYYKLDTNGDDFSGNAYHGTLVDPDPNGGGASFTTGGGGMLGEALDLNGTLAHIITGSGIADALNGNEAITMSAWVKSNSNTFTDAGFLQFHEPHNSDDGGMRYDSNTGDDAQNVLKVSVGLEGDSEHNIESSDQSQSTEWRHYVMTWARGENMKFYINGTLNVLSEISANPEADLAIDHYTALYIGLGAKDELDGSNIGSGWDGLIDEVKIYNFPLSPEEVASLSFAISGVPVCLALVELDTNNDCIQNLEEMVEWMESYLDCTQVKPGGAGVGCVDTEAAP